MGHTHYWTVKGTLPKKVWATITTDVRAIVDHAIKNHVALVAEYDSNEPPEIDGDHIRFNGPGEAGHETFFVSRVVGQPEYNGHNPKWTFCKTAQKNYDIAVTAILAYLDSIHPGLFVVTSDGDLHEWSPGIALARDALPNHAEKIFAPRAVGNVETPVSWAPEVIADSSGWSRNALRFATKEEAEANARDLMMRWTAVREARAAESTDPVNYTYIDGKLEAIKS